VGLRYSDGLLKRAVRAPLRELHPGAKLLDRVRLPRGLAPQLRGGLLPKQQAVPGAVQPAHGAGHHPAAVAEGVAVVRDDSRRRHDPILTDTRYYPLFRRHCRPSCYPDEHYVHTYVNIRHAARNANRTVAYVDWSRGGPHPAMYGAGDVTPEFIRSIRMSAEPCMYNSRLTSTCYLFARKFAPNALDPLLNISSTVTQYYFFSFFFAAAPTVSV
jgi:hypothetical protein